MSISTFYAGDLKKKTKHLVSKTMQYMGGKARIAPHIAKILEANRIPNQIYVEPFLGAGSVFCLMEGPKIGSDLHPDLMEMWIALRDGWKPPSKISEEEWRRLKNESSPSALRGFVGFGCSFGGRFFEGYARNTRGDDYAAAASKACIAKAPKVHGAKLAHKDYRDLEFENALIYCDPPYVDTKSYSGLPKFDHAIFWETMRRWSLENVVFISEAKAPDDFVPVWEKGVGSEMCNISKPSHKRRREKLFVHKGILDRIVIPENL